MSRYKVAGANAVNAAGELDTADFLNVAKDDVLAWPKVARRSYPSTANARMESTLGPFVRKSLEINNRILEVFNDKLGLPVGALLELHKMEEFSGSEARIIRVKPTPSTTKQALGSHTDFGSLVRDRHVNLSPRITCHLISHSSTTDWGGCKSLFQAPSPGNTSRFDMRWSGGVFAESKF